MMATRISTVCVCMFNHRITCQNWVPWLSLSIHPYLPSCLIGLLGGILYPSICRSLKENVTYAFVISSPAVTLMSCLCYFHDLWDGRLFVMQLSICGLLIPWLVQEYSHHSCVFPIWVSLNVFLVSMCCNQITDLS